MNHANDTKRHALTRRQALRSMMLGGGALMSGGLWLRPLFGDAAPTAAPKARRPNIVFILADDQGHGDAGFTGGRDIDTPHLDRLAAEGVRFSDFYANAPICGPSRSAILSGLYPQQAGMYYNEPQPKRKTDPNRDYPELRHDVVLLPEVLKKAGYATGAVGKWHLGYVKPNLPNDRGFDDYYGFLGGACHYGPRHGGRLFVNDKPHDEQGHLTDLFTREAVSFVEKRADDDKPFFLYLAYNAPHGPIDVGAAMLPERVAKYEKRGLDPQRAKFAAIVDHLDEGVGKVLGAIDKAGIRENTVVVYMSDNGAMRGKGGSNAPFSGWKATSREGGFREPCIVRYPGVTAKGALSTSMVSSLDFFPTLAAWAGAEPPENLKGLDLRKHLKAPDKTPLGERTFFFEHKGEVAVRRGRWKLIGDICPGRKKGKGKKNFPEWTLFDLPADIKEEHNVAAKHPEIVQQLRAALDEWLETFEPHFWIKPN